MDLWVIFLTGLTVGGIGCLAVQGGLLASVIASREEEDLEEGMHKKHTVFPTLAFLIAKFIVYVILGFALGFFGQALQISETARILMQLFAGIYMLLVAGNLLNLHPIFRYVIIQPPKFLTRIVKNQSKSKDLFAPATLGVFSIFIPCGTTIAMEALAISSGSPFLGAAILGAFVLGTSPLFFLLGYITTVLGDTFKTKFLKVAAILVIYLGLSSINSALIVLNFPITFQSITDAVPVTINLNGSGSNSSNTQSADPNVSFVDGVQVAEIKVFPNGYQPNSIKVRSGVPVKLNLIPTGGYGCTSSFVIPSLGIRKNLLQKTSDSVEFTPSAPGKINWTCSMGMYYGVIEII